MVSVTQVLHEYLAFLGRQLLSCLFIFGNQIVHVVQVTSWFWLLLLNGTVAVCCCVDTCWLSEAGRDAFMHITVDCI